MGSNDTSDGELNALEEIILAKLQQKTPPRMGEDTYLVKCFRHYDLHGDGWCSPEQFKKALLPFISGISDTDLRAMFDRYAEDGALPYKNFASEFVHGVRRQPGFNLQVNGDLVETVEDTLMRMKVYLYSQGPPGIIGLAASVRDHDPQNARSLDFETFCTVLTGYFADTPCTLQEEHAEQLFQTFRQPYNPNVVAYDEFFMALKEEPGPERRASIRAAFRRLDPNSEGLVDIQRMIAGYSAKRHPLVSDGEQTPEEVVNEFVDTLRDLVAFRRGQRSYPTNLVAWEEFEDYYKFISGCFETDAQFCDFLRRVWDLDKVPDAKVEARQAAARPAAGMPPKSRAGLHHWQQNTLPPPHHFTPQHAGVKLDQVMSKARSHIAKQGLRHAVDVVKNFYGADDDVDDLLDVYEFRRACQESRLKFSDAEEACIFAACGIESDGDARPRTRGGSPTGKVQVPRFLQMMQGPMSDERFSVVEQAFRRLGGDPDEENSAISPVTLKENFACEAHPLVVRDELTENVVMSEFLDTFSLLAHTRGGCQNGMVSFSDFLAYYEVVSSIHPNDHFFDLMMHKVWSLPMVGEEASQTQRVGSPRGQADPQMSPRMGRATKGVPPPMAEPRPPRHTGPTIYNTSGDQTHRRFMRKEVPMPLSETMDGGYPGAQLSPAASCFSPITKSSIVFDEVDKSEVGLIAAKLRENVSRRGLRGFQALCERLEQNDHRRNGGVHKTEWERMNKTLGTGLSHEERASLFRGLSANRKDGAMDYNALISRIKGPLPDRRVSLVQRLFTAYRESSGDSVAKDELKAGFDPSHTPHTMLTQTPKSVGQQRQEFSDALDFFVNGELMDFPTFQDFFTIVSAIYKDDDDFRLMTTAAFGLPQGP